MVNMKTCPYCCEDIKEDAILCKHCKQRLDTPLETVQKSVSNNSNEEIVNTDSQKYTKEFILGLIGGIWGIFSGFSTLIFGAFFESFGGDNLVTSGSTSVIYVSIIAIIAICFYKKNNKIASLIVMGCSAVGFISTFVAFIIPMIFLLLSSISAFKKPLPTGKKCNFKIWIPVVVIASIIMCFSGFWAQNNSSISTYDNNVNNDHETSASSFEQDASSVARFDELLTYEDHGYQLSNFNISKEVEDMWGDTYVTEEIFLTIDLEVTNFDTGAYSFFGDEVTVLTEDGSAYSYSYEFSDNTTLNLNPNFKDTSRLVFNIPANLSGKVWLKVEDLFSFNYGLIDISDIFETYEEVSIPNEDFDISADESSEDAVENVIDEVVDGVDSEVAVDQEASEEVSDTPQSNSGLAKLVGATVDSVVSQFGTNYQYTPFEFFNGSQYFIYESPRKLFFVDVPDREINGSDLITSVSCLGGESPNGILSGNESLTDLILLGHNTFLVYSDFDDEYHAVFEYDGRSFTYVWYTEADASGSPSFIRIT